MDNEERAFQRKWETMQRILGAEARGDELRGFSSTRTLFGIKSHAEEVIERVAAEENARIMAKLEAERAAECAERAAEQGEAGGLDGDGLSDL